MSELPIHHVLSEDELADLELRLADLLDPSAFELAAGSEDAAAVGAKVLLDDRGRTPVARLTVTGLREGSPAVLVGLVEGLRPVEGGVARSRRVTARPVARSTVVALDHVPDGEPLAEVLATAEGPVRLVAVTDSRTPERAVLTLLDGLGQVAARTGATTEVELLVLPYRATVSGRDALRREVLIRLSGGGAVVDRCDPDVAALPGPLAPVGTAHGVTVLLTGLSGSGKSTIARALADHLLRTDPREVTLLDGDEVRQHLSAGLGFSPQDRRTNLLRIAWVAGLVTRHGGIAICAPIAPYAAVRAEMRALVEPHGRLLLVHVSTPLEVCEARDRKGLYARARAGEITGFTGIDDPYEVPADADLRLDTSQVEVDEAVRRILDALRG